MTSSNESSLADLEPVRRIELQATCFGALFIAGAAGRGAINTSTATAAIADYGNTDDSDTHGSRKHQLSWARAGAVRSGVRLRCHFDQPHRARRLRELMDERRPSD